MAAVLEDVSGAQNVEKHLDDHKGPKNLWVISPFFFFFWDWTRNSGPESQNILEKFIYQFHLRSKLRVSPNRKKITTAPCLLSNSHWHLLT